MPIDLSSVRTTQAATIATASLSVATSGEGFFEITAEIARFLDEIKARDGAVLIFLRHTSALLVIQENANPGVRTDLVTALKRIAPALAGWVHEVEGPDYMPAHIKSMLNGVSLHAPVVDGKMALGAWQDIYIAEHRDRPHRREVDAAIHRRLRVSVTAPMRITNRAEDFYRLWARVRPRVALSVVSARESQVFT